MSIGSQPDPGSAAETAATARKSFLEDIVRRHAVPHGEEDLDRDDNHWTVRVGEEQSHLRLTGRPVRGTPGEAWSDVEAVVAELARGGFALARTSRLGAGAVWGEGDRPAGWRAWLDIRLVHQGE